MLPQFDPSEFQNLPLSSYGPRACTLTGVSLLVSPHFNKGSAFTATERKLFGIDGLLPPHEQTLDEQVQRAYDQYASRTDDLAKNTFLTSLKEQNEVLFYKLLSSHLKEMFPIVYTPTEATAIENYSRIFRKPEGCFLSIDKPEEMEQYLANWGSPDDVDYIVVTDGEEILGIGDQGVGGILISVAKLLLTTLCAGINPARVLPVVLDVGTNNQKLLDDKLYLGLQRPRTRGAEYDNFVDKFVKTTQNLFPRAYLHFEDFGLPNARRILNKYRPSIACFNDDIQGTGCVTLAAIYAGLFLTKGKLQDTRVVVFGSGTAGIGIAEQIRDGIAEEGKMSREEAMKRIWCIDKHGLLLESQGDSLTPAQKEFARKDSEWKVKGTSLLDVVREVKPHILIGTSTCPGAFTEDIVREMAKNVDRPMIFPLSNPTRLHEAIPKDIYKWTDGKALVATGSPFDPVEHNGRSYEIAECNNSTCFPGIGLGSVLCRARIVSDKMLVAAIKALAKESPALKDPSGALLPDVVDVREISIKIACSVIKQAIEEGLAREKDIPENNAKLAEWVRAQMWEPQYRELKRVKAT